MLRMRWSLILALLFTTSLLTLFSYSFLSYSTTLAAPSLQGEDGEEYTVKRGDWLSKISQAFYGNTSDWRAIVAATNAKAATDSRFEVIEDPDAIEVGQLLWIPDDPDAFAPEEEADEEATDEETEDADAEETVAEGETVSETVETDSEANSEAMSGTVRFAAPQDGSIVGPTFDVEMVANGLTIEPAGEIHDGAGHFHILVDTDFIPAGELLPFDESHLHFGKGQLSTTLELEPGVHVLRLQFANGAHIALDGEQYHDTITVTVAAPASASASTSVTTTTTVTPTAATSEEDEEESGEEVAPDVHFVEPQDGDEVASPFDVTMAADGLTVEPAGEIHEGAGHLHILVDTDFVPPDELLPFDENHLHFGKGQLTTTLELEPGVHVLNLQFANGAHIALDGEQYRDTITVTVTGD